MQVFKDVNGEEWTIDLNLRTARDIRRRMQARKEQFENVDFLDYATLLFALNDYFFLADLLEVVLEPQIQDRELTPGQFGELLKGETIANARAAFVAEYVDFFPEPTAKAKILAVVEKNDQARKAIDEAILTEAEKRIQEVAEIAATTFGERSSGKSDSPAEVSQPSPN